MTHEAHPGFTKQNLAALLNVKGGTIHGSENNERAAKLQLTSVSNSLCVMAFMIPENSIMNFSM